MLSPSNPRRRLITSAVVLLTVLVIAVVAQFRRTSVKAEPATTRDSHEPRAVFGGPPEAEASTGATNENIRDRQPGSQEPRSGEPPLSTQRGMAGKGGIKGDMPSDIRQFMERWRTSLLEDNIDLHVSMYAPRVDRFFRRRNVSRDFVRREKELVLNKYPKIEQYDLTDFKVDRISTNRMAVTFRKDWDFRGRRRFAGSELARLALRNDSGNWQITGEEEIKIFKVQR